MCYEDGGIVDDLIIYRLASEEYMMVVNGANIDKDWDWVVSQNTMGAELENASDDYVLLALQGPKSADLLSELTDTAVQQIPFYAFEHGEVCGVPSLISATGYTGEKGFELYINAKKYDAHKVFEALVTQGAGFGCKLCGLGARDTLRLEKGYALYGNDITSETQPLQARLGWITKLSKGPFVGSNALIAIKEKGVEKAIPRKGYELLDAQSNIVGKVTSGGMSISLEKGIGLAYIQTDALASNEPIVIQIRNKEVPITVTSPPFV
jgi:aminomethyltransferase